MSKGFTWPRRTRQSRICLSSSTQAVVGCPGVEESGPGRAGWPVAVAGLVSAPPPLPPPVGRSESALLGSEHLRPFSPGLLGTCTQQLLSAASTQCPRQPLLEGAWGQVPPPSAGSWSREAGRDHQPLAAFSVPLWERGFGESQVAYLLCAAASSSCVPFRLPATPSGRRAVGRPLVPIRFPAGRGQPPSCGQGGWFVESLGGGGGWRTVPWEGQWLPVPAGGHLCHVPPWSQSPWLLPAAVCQIGSRLLSERRGCLMRRCQTP